MKKLILSLTVAACAAATGLVQAQDEKPKRPAAGAGGGGGAGGANRFTPEDRLKMLTASLGLTQEQQDKVKKVLDESKPDFEKIRALPQEERRPKFRELMQKQNDQIAEVLTPEQKEKFKTAMATRGQGQGQNRASGGDANAPKKEGDKAAPEEKK
jgi:Spy/CpxP family protein refolding chaperone